MNYHVEKQTCKIESQLDAISNSLTMASASKICKTHYLTHELQ